MNAKDKKIIEDAERENIPIFVFTAKDKYSPAAIREYYQNCVGGGTSQEHRKGIIDRHNEFTEWQDKHKHKVKIPD